MDSKSSLFNTFFEEHSSVDKNYRFTTKGLRLAMQVFSIIEDQSFNEASSYDSHLKDAVKSVKFDFKKLVCLFEKAHKARKAIVAAFRARNPGIGKSRIPDDMESRIRNAVTVVLKAVLCVFLLVTYLSSNSLLDAVSTITTVIVFGGLAVAASIAAWEHPKTNEEVNSVEATASPDGMDYRNIWDTFIKILYVTGGSILLGALLIPSTTLSIVSVLCTIVFYGCLTALTAIALWELYLNDNPSTETNGILNNEDKAKEMSLKNWFHCSHRLIKALEDIIGPVPNTYSLVIALTYLSKKRKDLDAELWMKKYLHNTNSFCILVQQKYGILLTPVVVSFVFVVLIFHDRNRYLLESVWETRGFISNSNRTIEMDFRTIYATDDINWNLNETYRKIWENLDIIYKEGFETETYKFEIPPGANPHFELNEAHQTKHWKGVKNQAHLKKLDKLVFENPQEHFSSSILGHKKINSDDVEEYIRKEIPEKYKKLLKKMKIKGSDKELLEFLKAEEYKKTRRNSKNPFHSHSYKQSELSGQVIVKSEKNEKNEIAQIALVKDSKDKESLKTERKHRNFKIQQAENMNKEIPTLEELEERLECLLDDGTRVKQWLIDLEERFKNLF